jgi:hypothetical protein
VQGVEMNGAIGERCRCFAIQLIDRVARNLGQDILGVVSSNGNMPLPRSLRQRDRVRAGNVFEVERLSAGKYLLKRKPKRKTASVNSGLVELLLSCPEKGWFISIPSEFTDTL